MLTIVIGKNKEALAREIKKLTKGVHQYIEGSTATALALDSLLHDVSLFETKIAPVIISDVLVGECGDLVRERADAFVTSDRVFIFTTDTLLVADKKIFKNATLVELPPTQEKKERTPFALTDAVLARNKLEAWSIFRKLSDSGAVAREIHGALFWQIKCMILAGRGAGVSGLAPFVFTKAVSGRKKYKDEELVGLTRNLVHMLHKTQLQNNSLETELELLLMQSL